MIRVVKGRCDVVRRMEKEYVGDSHVRTWRDSSGKIARWRNEGEEHNLEA